jgi:hypothetical protein
MGDDHTALRNVLLPLLHNIDYENYDMTGPDNLVSLIEGLASYTATWGQAFVQPPRPTPYNLTIADDATAVVCSRQEAIHAQKLIDYATYATAERCTAKFIHEAINEVHYKDLFNPGTFYNNVTAVALPNHLKTNCGGLHTTTDLINLPIEMIGYYNNAAGIPEYTDQLEEARKKLLAELGGKPE